MNPVNVLLASAGRRPYLVRWFQEAIAEIDASGKVVVADNDPYAPSRGFGAIFELAPRVSHPEYKTWLAEVLQRHEITLALSLNDFELSKWATAMPVGDHRFSTLLRLSAQRQGEVEDKLAMAELLGASEILTPPTFLASEISHRPVLPSELGDSAVVKGRFGSGSRGLSIVSLPMIAEAVRRAGREVTDASGELADDEHEAQSLTIVQGFIPGQEYGLDVVADLNGRHQAVLARKKISMRSGETDRAVSVDPAPFSDLGRSITRALGHKGLVDVDVICDEDSNLWVIDINPRFGGGYPFSHLAGARIPSAYIAWAASREAERSWLTCSSGVVGAKYVDTAIVGLTDADR